VFYFGPMILIGAGAGALMSFQFTGAQNEPDVIVTPFTRNSDYDLTMFTDNRFKNGLLRYDYSLNDEKRALLSEQRNFFFFGYTAPPEEQEKMSEEINKILNVVSIDDLTHL
ncbi:hypothetical protein, partial [Vibrio azureus]